MVPQAGAARARVHVRALGPAAIPRITGEEEAKRAPELSVLSVLAHGRERDGVRLGEVALLAVATLADETQVLYSDVILNAVTAAAKVALEELMDIRKYEFKSDFAKKHQAKGREEGLAEGRRARIADLIAVLEARGLAVSPEEQHTIATCTDDAVLTRWIRRAATAASVQEVLAEG